MSKPTGQYMQRFKHRIIGSEYSVTFYVVAHSFIDVQYVYYDVRLYKMGVLILKHNMQTIFEVLEFASKFIL